MTKIGGLYQGCISLDGVNDGDLIADGALTWKCGEPKWEINQSVIA
jgi:hypothetical protein